MKIKPSFVKLLINCVKSHPYNPSQPLFSTQKSDKRHQTRKGYIFLTKTEKIIYIYRKALYISFGI